MLCILGKKIEMSQSFDEQGKVAPVTLIMAGPCFITQIKTKERDGYEAVQIGFEPKKQSRVKKSEQGKGYKYLKEFRNFQFPISQEPLASLAVIPSELNNFQIGNKIDISLLKEGDKVRVSGISKGKGFQGAVKRWGFHGRNATHGVKHEQRTLGSVGATDPARVFPGKKMPGRMGGARVTVKNLKIVKIDVENNLIALKGAVPGRRGTLVEIRS